MPVSCTTVVCMYYIVRCVAVQYNTSCSCGRSYSIALAAFFKYLQYPNICIYLKTW